MTPDQVEDAGWSPELWAELNELAARTAEEHAQLRTILPRGPDAPNAYSVETSSFREADGVLSFQVATSKKVSRLSVRFRIEPEQLHDTHRIRDLVARAAVRLAQKEDHVLALGYATAAPPDAAPPDEGLLRPGIPIVDCKDGHVEALTRAARCIRSAGYAGTFRAALGFDVWTALATKDPDKTITGLDRARLALGALDAAMIALPPHTESDASSIVFAPSPGALDLVWSKRTHIAYVGTTNGGLDLRVEEAFLLRVADPKALVHVRPATAPKAASD
ncbi:MAG TPA: family 1 encapsulin nanocompartment shell protein [Polyangiaceae bacterium]|jgi:uncharacterized linocin/CFP29 family protein|nr:family 1 encapsulin nanocompartment shell protein [Polyangiaceae bacterium]